MESKLHVRNVVIPEPTQLRCAQQRIVGLAPTPPQTLFDYLEDVTRYLRGRSVSLARAAGSATNRLGRALPLADAPSSSRIEWLRDCPTFTPVPIFAAASGPKVLAGAARFADLVMLAVGADPARITWARDIVRRSNPAARVGAYACVVVDEDFGRGTQLASGHLAVMGRFSAMHGKVYGDVGEVERQAMETIARQYPMTAHGLSTNGTTDYTKPIAERFAIIGTARYCHARLDELEALGVSRFNIVGPPPDSGLEANRRFVDEVLRLRPR